MNRVAELREAAIAAWQTVSDFYEAHATDGELSAEDQAQLDGLNDEAKKADEAYARAAAAAGQAQSARDRINTYAQAVVGQPVNWSRVATATPVSGQGDGTQSRGSLGAQFVESDVYHDLVASGALGSDRARIGQSRMFKAAANTDILQTETSGPLNAFLRPTYVPDILPLGARPRTIRNLFTQDTAPDGEIKDVRQTSRSGAAAAVGQSVAANGSGAAGGVKPQVSAAWTPYSVFPVTIAAWAATTRQALASENRTRTLIDTEINLQVELAEEDEIVRGNGTAPSMSGLLDQPDLQEFDAATFYSLDTVANLAAIRHAKTMVRTGVARVPADALVVHPNDSEQLDLLQDAMGRFRAGDPFSGSSDDSSPVWRLPRVESEAIDEGTAIVGAFKLGGTVYAVQPIQMYVSDSHEDYFIRNLIAILGEERIALSIRRPAAFVVITLADWVTGS